MPMCEKCWADAYLRDCDDQPSAYHRLLEDRADNPCTPEQQAGPDATTCEQCGRRAVHQIANVCMNCKAEGKSQ